MLTGIHVSLPSNNLQLAQIAADLGAEGLKTHINVLHRASGMSFGDLDTEASSLREILSLGLPTGLVVGSGDRVREETIRSASSMGFAYFDLYADEMPDGYVAACAPTTPMAALGPNQTPADAAALVAGGIQALELSTLPPEQYGSPLSTETVTRLQAVRAEVNVPLVVPSQHRLVPTDIPRLIGAGADVILLGAVVLGRTRESLEETLPQFLDGKP